MEREFLLARDKTFRTTVRARGAKPGQVIGIGLLAGEAVEEIDPREAHVREADGQRSLDWVAADAAPELPYAGKWTAPSIVLKAPAGAVKEIWRVRCDEPYLCSFDGNAESLTGARGHAWAPLPGQKLEATWKQLEPQPGVHTVAQTVHLDVRPSGSNLYERLTVQWATSSGSLVGVRLPEGAVVSRLELQDEPIPILRDDTGAVQISLPAGRSTLKLHRELADAASWRIEPPAPSLSTPVGTLWHRVYVPDGKTAVAAWGLSGNPRVSLWPSLGAVLVPAFGALWLARRARTPLCCERLWLVVAAGFAILTPMTMVPLCLLLAWGRWLGTRTGPRGRARTFLDLCLLVLLAAVALGSAFATLQHALFARVPIETTSHVHPPDTGDWAGASLAWGAYLAGEQQVPVQLPTLPEIGVCFAGSAGGREGNSP